MGYFGKIVKKVEKFGDLDTFKSTLYAKHTMGGLKELLNDTFKNVRRKAHERTAEWSDKELQGDAEGYCWRD